MWLVLFRVPGAERGTGRFNQSFASLEASLSILPFILLLHDGMAWGASAGGQTTAHFYSSLMTKDIGYMRPQADVLWICSMPYQDMTQDIFLYLCSF